MSSTLRSCWQSSGATLRPLSVTGSTTTETPPAPLRACWRNRSPTSGDSPPDHPPFSKEPTLPTHSIAIRPTDRPGHHTVSGAVSVASTASPVIEAAKALKAAGANDRDLIRVVCADINFSPVSVGAVLKLRAPLRQSDVKRAHSSNF